MKRGCYEKRIGSILSTGRGDSRQLCAQDWEITSLMMVLISRVGSRWGSWPAQAKKVRVVSLNFSLSTEDISTPGSMWQRKEVPGP